MVVTIEDSWKTWHFWSSTSSCCRAREHKTIPSSWEWSRNYWDTRSLAVTLRCWSGSTCLDFLLLYLSEVLKAWANFLHLWRGISGAPLKISVRSVGVIIQRKERVCRAWCSYPGNTALAWHIWRASFITSCYIFHMLCHGSCLPYEGCTSSLLVFGGASRW